MDVIAWRKQRRAELIALSKAIPPGRAAPRTAHPELLLEGFPQLAGLTRFLLALQRRGRSAHRDPRCASSARARRFRWSSRRTRRSSSANGRPASRPSPASSAFRCRNRHGRPRSGADAAGGFRRAGLPPRIRRRIFDRTLAALSPQPLKIGLAREVSRIETIHPQPHDIPMDFVITPSGVHEVVQGRLRLRRLN